MRLHRSIELGVSPTWPLNRTWRHGRQSKRAAVLLRFHFASPTLRPRGRNCQHTATHKAENVSSREQADSRPPLLQRLFLRRGVGTAQQWQTWHDANEPTVIMFKWFDSSGFCQTTDLAAAAAGRTVHSITGPWQRRRMRRAARAPRICCAPRGPDARIRHSSEAVSAALALDAQRQAPRA